MKTYGLISYWVCLHLWCNLTFIVQLRFFIIVQWEALGELLVIDVFCPNPIKEFFAMFQMFVIFVTAS